MTLDELYDMAEEDGIRVDAFELGSREAMSLQDENGKCYIAIDPMKLASTADEKTKLAHELGHCETGAFYNEYSPQNVRGKLENKANRWSIQRIVPRGDLERYVAQGYREPWELAELFNVNEDMVRLAMHYYRYGNLAM